MKPQFSDRILGSKKSFVREILKYLGKPGIISFSGGFPNPESFPVDEMSEALADVMKESGKTLLQYSGSEGYLPLREWISKRYKTRFNMDVDVNDILIVNGSQQALDLIGKVFINKNDHVIMEDPAYLGAIQAFDLFEPTYHQVKLTESGLDIQAAKQVIEANDVKLMYLVPNFQNPSGLTYSEENRLALAQLMEDKNIVIVEDDPYGELRFFGKHRTPIRKLLPEHTIMMGSFSKIVSPGMRLGWLVAPKSMYDKLLIAKQASDLHSNMVSQYAIAKFLEKNGIDTQIQKITELYRVRREAMVQALDLYLPKDCSFTQPEGGMFLWVNLPEGMDAMKLFDLAAATKNVVFVPGAPFYTDQRIHSNMRLNYTAGDPDTITEGIKRLCESIEEFRKAS